MADVRHVRDRGRDAMGCRVPRRIFGRKFAGAGRPGGGARPNFLENSEPAADSVRPGIAEFSRKFGRTGGEGRARRGWWRSAAVVVVCVLASAVGTAALPPLAENRAVAHQMLAAAVGDRIRTECPTISARLFVVWRKVRALERYALKQGYSAAQIDAYTSSDAHRAALAARAEAWLAERGARPGDAAAHCRVGAAEIAANSPIGELLRNR